MKIKKNAFVFIILLLILVFFAATRLYYILPHKFLIIPDMYSVMTSSNYIASSEGYDRTINPSFYPNTPQTYNPLYILLIAVISLVSGLDGFILIKFFELGIFMLAIVLMFLLVRHITKDDYVSLLASFALAFVNIFSYMSLASTPRTLIYLVSPLILLLIVKGVDSNKERYFYLASFLIAVFLTYHFNPIILCAPLGFAVFLSFIKMPLKLVRVLIICFIIGALVLMTGYPDFLKKTTNMVEEGTSGGLKESGSAYVSPKFDDYYANFSRVLFSLALLGLCFLDFKNKNHLVILFYGLLCFLFYHLLPMWGLFHIMPERFADQLTFSIIPLAVFPLSKIRIRYFKLVASALVICLLMIQFKLLFPVYVLEPEEFAGISFIKNNTEPEAVFFTQAIMREALPSFAQRKYFFFELFAPEKRQDIFYAGSAENAYKAIYEVIDGDSYNYAGYVNIKQDYSDYPVYIFISKYKLEVESQHSWFIDACYQDMNLNIFYDRKYFEKRFEDENTVLFRVRKLDETGVII
jgi:hypothetical protein